MFQTDQYARFLRIIGYEGGFPITIQCKNESGCSRVVSSPVSLILRTNEIFVIYDTKQRIFLEIPKNDIENIFYQSGGLDKQTATLPFSQ